MVKPYKGHNCIHNAKLKSSQTASNTCMQTGYYNPPTVSTTCDDRGGWYFSNGDKLSCGGSIFQSYIAQRVDLWQTGGGTTSGKYRCDIETVAVMQQ